MVICGSLAYYAKILEKQLKRRPGALLKNSKIRGANDIINAHPSLDEGNWRDSFDNSSGGSMSGGLV